MKKILNASSNKTVIDTVNWTCKLYSSYFEANTLSDTEKIISYIDYELPEIKILDYTSKDIDCQRVLSEINRDPWLHYGGIIAVCQSKAQVEELEELKDNNMVAIQTISEFQQHFSRMLRILWQNQQFLFNRGMQDEIGGEENGAFTCGNDPMDLKIYSNFLVSYLYNTNRISGDDKIRLQMTLNELLTNALEHGNLNISYQDKTAWLETGNSMITLIEKRGRMSEYADRKIHINYTIGKQTSSFTIKDDGEGFDWKKMEMSKTGENEMHGRGINLSRELVNGLHYNEKGNQVSFEIKNRRNEVNTIPGIMEPFESIEYKDKQIVCRENEMSNDLFFIVSGRYAVYSGRKLATVLTPNDMFIGEMAFLLNNRRTATVLAAGNNCRLIRIPKNSFLTLIRRNPHYGIFLSKMLAQRLLRQTQATNAAQKKLIALEQNAKQAD